MADVCLPEGRCWEGEGVAGGAVLSNLIPSVETLTRRPVPQEASWWGGGAHQAEGGPLGGPGSPAAPPATRGSGRSGSPGLRDPRTQTCVLLSRQRTPPRGCELAGGGCELAGGVRE